MSGNLGLSVFRALGFRVLGFRSRAQGFGSGVYWVAVKDLNCKHQGVLMRVA